MMMNEKTTENDVAYAPITLSMNAPHSTPSDPIPIGRKAAQSAPSLRVLDADIQQVHHCRDFCRIEAFVTVTYLSHPAQPPHTARVLTSVPLLGHGQDNNLRTRLIESAVRLSILLNRTHQNGLSKAA